MCGLSGLLHELVNHWADVVTFLLDTVHVSVFEADGGMQMRFALWAIIMQIGKILSLPCSFWGECFKKLFGFVRSNRRFDRCKCSSK